MARTSIDPAAAIPEADLLDQHIPVTPEPLSTAAGAATADVVLGPDSSDVLDQLTTVPDDGADEYPHAQEWPEA